MTTPPAQPSAAELIERDGYAVGTGVQLHQTDDGWFLELVLDESHTNFLGVGHGAIVFGLADVALSLACNAEQSTAYAVDATISFVRAVRAGDVLRATAEPIRATRRLGWYRIDVTTDDDELVATFTGTVYRPDPH